MPLTQEDEKKKRGWILAALMSTMMLAAMDTTIVSTAIPQIVESLGGFRLFTWVFSIYLLTQTITIPIYGKLSDLFGRKKILLFGISLFLASSLACAFAWDLFSLIVFRGVQGVGAGAIMATVNTLAGDLYSIKERASIQGWLSSVWGFAAITGPLLGGTFADHLSWRWIFLVNIPIGLASMALIWSFLNETFEKRRPKIDYAGSVLVLLTVGLFVMTLLEGGNWGWSSQKTITTLLSAFALLGLTIVVERRAKEPVMPGWVWKRRALAGSNLGTLCLGIAMMAPNAYLPTFLQSVSGASAVIAGLVLASMSLGWPTASALSGRLYLKIDFRNTALIGAFIATLATLCFQLIPNPKPLYMIVMTQIGIGAGFGLLSTPLLVGAQSTVGWSQRGIVTGANMFCRYLGQSLGAALFGAIFNARIAEKLQAAPGHLVSLLPQSFDQVVDQARHKDVPLEVRHFLQDSISFATDHLFWAMTIITVCMGLAVLLVPKKLTLHEEKRLP